MSPVGGIGINLAVADAVAAARILAGPLRTGRAPAARLARVQARRWAPTAFMQAMQRAIHARVVAVAMTSGDPQPPRAVRLVAQSRRLRWVLAYLVAIGPLPEHAPRYARRGG